MGGALNFRFVTTVVNKIWGKRSDVRVSKERKIFCVPI